MRLVPLPGVFQPPSDSWLLAEQLRREPVLPEGVGLDLCTGSGVLAIAAARSCCPRMVAVDVSRRAVLAVRANAALNHARVRALRGDLYEPVRGEQFDLIVSNPPYLPTPDGRLPVRGLARAWEGGHDGRTFVDRICAQASAHLRPGGKLFLVHSHVCGEDATLSALSAQGMSVGVVARQRGPLGPLLQSRRSWLESQGLLTEDGQEEMLVIRAQAPIPATDRVPAPTVLAR